MYKKEQFQKFEKKKSENIREKNQEKNPNYLKKISEKIEEKNMKKF